MASLKHGGSELMEKLAKVYLLWTARKRKANSVTST
jgi:hypothetical protein